MYKDARILIGLNSELQKGYLKFGIKNLEDNNVRDNNARLRQNQFLQRNKIKSNQTL